MPALAWALTRFNLSRKQLSGGSGLTCFRNQDTSVSKAKQAIAAFAKASSDRDGLAELMVFYCEQAAGFCSDICNDDEAYFGAMVRMFEQALKLTDTLPADRRNGLIARLERVCVTSHNFGYGVGDEMDYLLSKYADDAN